MYGLGNFLIICQYKGTKRGTPFTAQDAIRIVVYKGMQRADDKSETS